MGIRFRCHHCESELHVKDFQGGKRGRCPECRGKFRIPTSDAPHSLEVDELAQNGQTTPTSAAENAVHPQPRSQKPEAVPSPETAAPQVSLEEFAATSVSEPSASSSLKTDAAAPPDEVSPAPAPTNPSTDSHPAPAPTLSTALQDAPDANWYVRPPSGGQFGPASQDIFQQWLAEKRVSRDSLVWRDGWPEWQVAEQAFSDYFTPEDSEVSPEDSMAVSSPSSNAAPPDPTATQPSLGERNRLQRRQRRRRNYLIMVAVLSVLAILLVTALIVVLVWQQ